MAIRISIIVSLTILSFVCSTKVIPPEDVMCPMDCHCYYLGINWQTDCSESNMTTLPLDRLYPDAYTLIMNLNNLEKIDPIPPNIKVKSLQLSHNFLTTIQKETFAGLQYLVDLGLSSNLINYIHPEAFIENSGLNILQLQNNPLKPVDGPFLHSKSLRFLDLSNCQLTVLSHQFFSKVNGLIKIDLSGNPLRIIEAGVFDSLTNLKRFNLNNCNLTQITRVAQNQNASILPENNLKSYVNWTLIIGKSISLEQLEVKQTGLTNLPEYVFSYHNNIRRLVLAENHLSDSDLVTTLGQNLENLDYLDLSYCNITTPLSKYAFVEAKKLHTLILSGNNLSASGLGVAFSPLSKLVKLSLSDCGLTELPENTFQNLTSLKELDLSKNPMTKFFYGTLAIINRLHSLEHLNMSYTNVDVIKRLTAVKIGTLKSLILSGNNIKRFASGFLNNFSGLKMLELNYCGLDGLLDRTLFDGVSEHPVIEELRLSGNRIRMAKYKFYFRTSLPKLKILDMSYCNLTSYSDGFQFFAPSLKRLLLNNNNFNDSLDLSFFYYPLVFEHLDLSYNKFTSFAFNRTWDYKLMPNSSNITSLMLFGNPWVCDCSIPDLLKWAKRGLVGSHLSIATNKQSKSLVCDFNPKMTPFESLYWFEPCLVSGRECITGVQYTWARYVHEFGDICFCLLHYKPRSSCHYGWRRNE